MIELSSSQPVASGHLRLVYQHPERDDLLVKVFRADVVADRWRRGRWYRRLARTGPYQGFVREFKEYLAARHHAPDRLPPIARVVGIVETDLGVGQVVEAVRDANGSLACTLAAWVQRDGLTPEIQAYLDDLLTGLLTHNVILGDFHPWNLVFGTDSAGGPRLVMIDGFGEKNFIPHCSMSQRHNAARTRHKFAKVMARLRTMGPTRVDKRHASVNI
ncbi:YrbL family protein [Oleiagrimonas sp. C23AA]|uniref:YrbL family protein n=1 Tax=Oleiagrimonas sp. C23AA TaxID=2719047 RepID=UPI00141D8BD5|nr:YrbL family protein [Oleiagrimonas sp. C23AA]NII10025.1 hypothetical protein [Oleiagrimonas sp. C23AA]